MLPCKISNNIAKEFLTLRFIILLLLNFLTRIRVTLDTCVSIVLHLTKFLIVITCSV